MGLCELDGPPVLATFIVGGIAFGGDDDDDEYKFFKRLVSSDFEALLFEPLLLGCCPALLALGPAGAGTAGAGTATLTFTSTSPTLPSSASLSESDPIRRSSILPAIVKMIW